MKIKFLLNYNLRMMTKIERINYEAEKEIWSERSFLELLLNNWLYSKNKFFNYSTEFSSHHALKIAIKD